ncbi:flagellar biosynthesis anti-sigma factor FlgM [Ramlibacter sp.]|uniref:flagellar biosynthesis anti-sigma factor FlgM n=1 Tax=Ramlibacter sp. TaxID=1917967 RepID=UPI003D0F8A6F
MKIGSPVPHDPAAAAASPLRGARAAAAPAATQSAAPAASATVEQVQVSAAAASLVAPGSGDFDAAKVAAIRTAILEGRFEIDADAIADRLIADAADMLRQRPA